MKKETKKILVIIGVMGWLGFLFQSIDLAMAKDPDYPTKPITFYINFAGGSTDISCRALLEATSKYLGQPLIPVIKTGGAGTVGAMAVMSAKPDGYTLGVCQSGTLTILPHTEECPYKDLSGFTLIANFGKQIYPLTVRSDAPWNTWKEFIEWARKNPRAAKIGTSGARSTQTPSMAMWVAEQREKAEFTFVVFKGGGEVLMALLGGHITMNTQLLDISTAEYINQGKLRILAFLRKEDKMPGYESLPSIQELYGFDSPAFLGVWGPKGLPEYVVKKLDDAFTKAVEDPRFVEVMNRMYMPIVYMDRAKMEKEVNEMFPKMGEIVKILRAEEAKVKK